MEILEKIKAELKVFEDKKKKLTEELRKEFPKLLQPLLEQSKVIDSISWTQYTPYFNDGDECEFSVHVDDLQINGLSEYELEDNPASILTKRVYNQGYKPNPNYDAIEGKILENIKNVLTEVPDDFYKDLFGDHAYITINKSGEIKVDGYDHE